MKIEIDISPENFEFLKQLMTQINTQNNHGTASPYYYTVRTTKDIAVPAGTTGTDKYYYDGECYTEEELRKVCKEDETDFEKVKDNSTKYGVDQVNVYENFFLTEEGYNKHMELNGHNYRSSIEPAHFYIKHAFRNPELVQLLDTLGEVTGLGHKKH